jgi:phage-related protein
VSAPLTHVEESLKLSADAYVDLFEVRLTSGATVYFWNGVSREWQGNTYEQLACQMQGDTITSDGKYSRPQLTVVSPSKIFGPFAAEGLLDLALVTRKRLLQDDYLNNVPVFQQNVWLIGRVVQVSSQAVTVELRQTTDMPVWMTPKRTFNPPKFPFVVLSQ